MDCPGDPGSIPGRTYRFAIGCHINIVFPVIFFMCFGRTWVAVLFWALAANRSGGTLHSACLELGNQSSRGLIACGNIFFLVGRSAFSVSWEACSLHTRRLIDHKPSLRLVDRCDYYHQLRCHVNLRRRRSRKTRKSPRKCSWWILRSISLFA